MLSARNDGRLNISDYLSGDGDLYVGTDGDVYAEPRRGGCGGGGSGKVKRGDGRCGAGVIGSVYVSIE